MQPSQHTRHHTRHDTRHKKQGTDTSRSPATFGPGSAGNPAPRPYPPRCTGSPPGQAGSQGTGATPPLPRELAARARYALPPEERSDCVAVADAAAFGEPAAGAFGSADKTPGLPLSRTTDYVLRLLLNGDLSRLRADTVAESLGISPTTLRRRLRGDHTSYQFLLDRARQYRCEAQLRQRWLPGKCLAEELGYLEINSFYRAFRRWTGVSYSEYKQRREQPGHDRAAGGETAGALPPGAAAGNAAASPAAALHPARRRLSRRDGAG
jgi:AraC family mar-sox-rob regulon transcriptional activator